MKNCIFCQIVSGAMTVERLFEDDQCLAFPDINPQAPTHILVIPKLHLASLNEIDRAPEGLLHHLMSATRDVAARLGLETDGYRVVINTGPHGGQTVFHLHIHLLGGRPMGWPPG